MCVFICVQLFLVPWIIVCQAPMSTVFSRQEYWSELTFSTPRDLPDPGIEPVSLMSPALEGRFFTSDATWEAQLSKTWINYSFSLMFFFFFQLLPSDDSLLSTYLNIPVFPLLKTYCLPFILGPSIFLFYLPTFRTM